MVPGLKLKELNNISILHHKIGTVPLYSHNSPMLLTELPDLLVLRDPLPVLPHVHADDVGGVAHGEEVQLPLRNKMHQLPVLVILGNALDIRQILGAVLGG